MTQIQQFGPTPHRLGVKPGGLAALLYGLVCTPYLL